MGRKHDKSGRGGGGPREVKDFVIGRRWSTQRLAKAFLVNASDAGPGDLAVEASNAQAASPQVGPGHCGGAQYLRGEARAVPLQVDQIRSAARAGQRFIYSPVGPVVGRGC